MNEKQLQVPLIGNRDRGCLVGFRYVTTPVSQEYNQVGSKVL